MFSLKFKFKFQIVIRGKQRGDTIDLESLIRLLCITFLDAMDWQYQGSGERKAQNAELHSYTITNFFIL